MLTAVIMVKSIEDDETDDDGNDDRDANNDGDDDYDINHDKSSLCITWT